jgi:hypothetical protein
VSEPKVKRGKVTDLTPDKKNANRGTERGLRALDHSLRQYGAGRSILVDKHGRIIAGNKTHQGAADIGLEDVLIVQTDGKQLVAVQRTDLDLETDEAARAMAYADNRVGQLDLEFDPAVILVDLDAGLDLSALWNEGELSELAKALEDEKDDSSYSRKIEAPIYEPNNVKPAVSDLFDDTRTQALIRDIQAAEGLTEDERRFLTIAAQRHTVLRFNKIADYYAHADAPRQKLMEDSALVIIDFNRAIELGFVQLTKQIAEQVKDEYGE